jgi:hypothetical protein
MRVNILIWRADWTVRNTSASSITTKSERLRNGEIYLLNTVTFVDVRQSRQPRSSNSLGPMLLMLMGYKFSNRTKKSWWTKEAGNQDESTSPFLMVVISSGFSEWNSAHYFGYSFKFFIPIWFQRDYGESGHSWQFFLKDWQARSAIWEWDAIQRLVSSVKQANAVSTTVGCGSCNQCILPTCEAEYSKGHYVSWQSPRT